MTLPKSCTVVGRTCNRGGLSVAEIKVAVCAEFDVPMIDMTSERRGRAIARPRQAAMYLARHLTPFSLPNIGRFFHRDHTTVMHAISSIDNLRSRTMPELNDEDAVFRHKVETLYASLVSEAINSLVDKSQILTSCAASEAA